MKDVIFCNCNDIKCRPEVLECGGGGNGDDGNAVLRVESGKTGSQELPHSISSWSLFHFDLDDTILSLSSHASSSSLSCSTVVTVIFVGFRW